MTQQKFDQMLRIDDAAFLDAGRRAVATRQRIEEVADAVTARGYESILFVGSGGTYANAWPYEELARKRSRLPVRVLEAAELVQTGDPLLGPGALVVVTSVSGTTEDVLAALEVVRKAGAHVIAFVPADGTPIGAAADDVVLTVGEWRGWDLYLLLLLTRLLRERGEYSEYDALAAELEHLPAAMLDVAHRTDPVASAFAAAHTTGDYMFTIGSGNLWGFTYIYSMCVLEEMLWIRTTRVTAAEFFHGSLELIEPRTPILVLQGEDEHRPLTERVIRFARRVSGDVTVFDTKDYPLTGFSDRFRPLLAPFVMNVATRRLSLHLQKHRGHDLDTRRYYRVVEY